MVTASAVSLTACSAILGLDEKPLATDAGATDAGKTTHDGGGTSHDTGTSSDAGTGATDGSREGSVVTDAACTPDDAGYHDPTNQGCWETHDVSVAFDSSPYYVGGSFDGRYVYFVSNTSALVVRFDTTAAFSSASAWTEFDVSTLPGGPIDNHLGSVFDGRFLYLISNSGSGTFARYDTTSSFTNTASWAMYTPDASNPTNYAGGAFDGRYVYFAPQDDGTGNPGPVLQLDTTGSFTAPASWKTFNVPASGGADAGTGTPPSFFGAVFTGKYVFFGPGLDGTSVARYDTTSPFTSASAWQLFDTSTLGVPNAGLSGVAFDGKDLYIVPTYASGTALAVDPTAPFTAKASWSTYSPAPSSGSLGSVFTPTFSVGGFDGRFLYFAPTSVNGQNGLFAREDTTAGFTDGSAWSTFDTTTFKPKGFGDFGAAVSDGKYMYFAPVGNPTFARFDAKEIASQPNIPHYAGSFL
jgi:hypothetical protein